MNWFPSKPRSRGEVLEELRRIAASDYDPFGKRMFGHVYDTGIEELRQVAMEAYEMYAYKTMLDFLVYPSVLVLERRVVRAVAELVNGETSVGSFTYGGTESIMLAVKAMRDYYRKKRPGETPEIILPETGHPAFRKAAHYLGVKVVTAPVDRETWRVDLDRLEQLITDYTGMIVGSAPNYPFGVMDDIEELSKIALDNAVWLHVDACMGGFILPFFRELGENIPDFDFSLPGVTSMSIDLHKYGYAPKGASVILYRSNEYRLYQFFVSVDWPGYPLVNTAVLSTRSAGALAAAWAVMSYLGREGYLKLAEKILRAKREIVRGLEKIGYRVLGEPESSLIAFTSESVRLPAVVEAMAKRGWYLQLQPGSVEKGYPQTIHLTISPVHEAVVDAFLEDLEEATREAERDSETAKAEETARALSGMVRQEIVENIGKLLESLGIGAGSEAREIDTVLIAYLIRYLPGEMVEKALALAVDKLFS